MKIYYSNYEARRWYKPFLYLKQVAKVKINISSIIVHFLRVTESCTSPSSSLTYSNRREFDVVVNLE